MYKQIYILRINNNSNNNNKPATKKLNKKKEETKNIEREFFVCWVIYYQRWVGWVVCFISECIFNFDLIKENLRNGSNNN